MNRSGGDLDVAGLRAAAYALLRREPDDRDAHLRLFEIEQMLGRPAAATAHLRRALAASRVLTTEARKLPAQLRVLALYRIAPWEGNLPFELIVDERRTTLHRFYIDDEDGDELLKRPLPPHDVVLTAIAWSKRAQPALALAERLAARGGRPVFNRASVIAGLSRDRVAEFFAKSTRVLAPPARQYAAAELAAAPLDFPVLVRPISSQAGVDLERVDDAAGLAAYLAAHPHKFYFVSPFVDYRSADGYYRKYRVAFVAGVPYAYHLAVSPHWMIHYYNAPMRENAWMRDEEARFVAGLESVFGGPLADALREIAAAIGLAYFAIDCGIAPDGRLLLFEADGAMLVHGTDDPAVFGYKRAAFERIQSALTAALAAAAGGADRA